MTKEVVHIQPLPNPDFSKLIETVKQITAHNLQNGWEGDDDSHYIYEEAMVAIYGKMYWSWRKEAFD